MKADLTKQHIYIDGNPVNKQTALHSHDLLKALSDLYNSIDSCVELTPDVLLKAKQAIKKATA